MSTRGRGGYGSTCRPCTDRLLPLSVLLKRERTSEKIEKPDILYGLASQSKKGEDFTFLKTECQRVPGNGFTTFSVFALFDGHNGSAAAIYVKENLLNNILFAVPSDLYRDEWLAALPRALVAGFIKTDKDFQSKAQSSGTTVTFVIIDGWTVTVASVGDSQCILESAEGLLYLLSADHRLDGNKEEVERITASGGQVGRLNLVGGAEIGPLRCWPGGLCLSRSIGDMDVGEYIVPIPHVKQVKLSSAGGRLIICSDGVWDSLSFESAVDFSRGLPADVAADKIVKEAVLLKGLRDDTTCIVVDLLPPEKISTSVALPKKPGMWGLRHMFVKRAYDLPSHHVRNYFEPYAVEELFEDGSAVLAQRRSSIPKLLDISTPNYGVSNSSATKVLKRRLITYCQCHYIYNSGFVPLFFCMFSSFLILFFLEVCHPKSLSGAIFIRHLRQGAISRPHQTALTGFGLNMVYPVCNMFKLLLCAVCQIELKPGEGISVHVGSAKSAEVRPWDGPLLCHSCQGKKEAMEGKKPSRDLSRTRDR